MSIETNLNVSPYFDDYDEAKEFYRVLFRPGVSVQVRELNQLQSIFQNQIERFGNHVFKNGTIVSGVNFQYVPYYPYVKIKDVNSQNQPVDVQTYSKLWVKNSANLIAKVINYQLGVESRDPDLNTLYLRYLNSGDTRDKQSFANSDVLTVFSTDDPLFAVNVENGGVNFSNSDAAVFLSALTINVGSGTFTNGETINQAVTGARGQILEINTTAIADTTFIKVKPLNSDLSNTSGTAAKWTFETGYNITGATSSAVANVAGFIGSGAAGEVRTDSLGVVLSIQLTDVGSGYVIPPHTTIKPLSVSASVSTLNLYSQNYLTNITVANSSFTSPVGNGYAFAVSEGMIYQKGVFLRVDPQLVIVEKYSSSPNNVVVGFDTSESIITSSIDETLFDNATGSPNETAPGANRLKLSPTLTSMSKPESEANTSFLPLVEFVEGFPYKENRVTVYNTLAKEFERRTHESAGDYVLDPFSVSTRELTISSTNTSPNTTHVQVVVDPGTAYISGSRVETLRNTLISIPKGVETTVREGQILTTSYGAYVLVNELAGSFDVKSGSTISLRDTAAQALSNTSSFTVTAAGNEIGTARIRSIAFNSGALGSPESLYELYLFDINMNQGKNFREVRSVYYNGTVKAVADINLELDPSLNSYVAVLKQAQYRSLVFNTNVEAAKVVNTAIFEYKTTDNSLNINANGVVTISLVTSGETFPYTAGGSLSDNQENEVIIIPQANLQAYSNIAGSVTFSGNVMTGTSTTFVNDLRVGDFIKVANTIASEVFSVTSISNNTSATVRAAPLAVSTGNVVVFFPAYRPLNFSSRTSRAITLSSNSTVLSANLGVALVGSNTVSASYKVRNTASGQVTKSVYRDCYVKLRLSDNVGGNTGPWCLGVPDVIRLKNVYVGDSTVNTSSADITKNFYVDANQNDDFYNLSYLVQQKKSSLELTSADYLLIKVDILQHSVSGGFKTISSYGNIDDSKTLTQSTNTINTLEIPFGLRDTVDFRPIVTATATVTNVAASATMNPANTVGFDNSTKYFPVPDSEFSYTVENYLGRSDRIIVTKNGDFEALQGRYGDIDKEPPPSPAEAMTLQIVKVPPYPSLAGVPSVTTSEFLTTLIGDSTGVKKNRRSTIALNGKASQISPQPLQYTMNDVRRLENRIQALEYQVSLNSLENQIGRLNIPSGLDRTVSRFKNGFFVDDFKSSTKADVLNSEFNAFIDLERGELQPNQNHINLQCEFDRNDTTTNNAIVSITLPNFDTITNVLMLPFAEHTLISQPIATTPIPPTPAVVVVPTLPATSNSQVIYVSVVETGTETVPVVTTIPPIVPQTQFNGYMMVMPSSFTVEGVIEERVTINLMDMSTYYGWGYGDGNDGDNA